MYIQPNAGEAPGPIPKEYHGHAFSPPAEREERGEERKEQEAQEAFARAKEQEAQEAFARAKEPPRHAGGGLLDRFPLLSSLLPPRAPKGEAGRGDFLSYVLIGLAVLLFLDDRADDILPLLLLLLLWD